MKSALVENGVVVNLILGQIDGAIPCADDVAIGWIFDNGAFSAPTIPAPEPAPYTSPQSVSLFQARAALLIYGAQIGRPNLLEQVDALVAGLPNGVNGMTTLQAAVIKEAWANAQEVKRSSPALNMIFPALGLTLPEQLDALFVIAAGISA